MCNNCIDTDDDYNQYYEVANPQPVQVTLATSGHIATLVNTPPTQVLPPIETQTEPLIMNVPITPDACLTHVKRKTCRSVSGCLWKKKVCSPAPDLAVCENVKSRKVCKLNEDCKWRRVGGKKECSTVGAPAPSIQSKSDFVSDCTPITTKRKCKVQSSCTWKRKTKTCNDIATVG
jgi:hypothetical protein